MNIYERPIANYHQFLIDNLPLRKSVNKCKVWYSKPASSKCKSMHITLDAYDKARSLRTMALHETPKREQAIDYYLDLENKCVVKLREWHKKIIYSQVYHGTKSNALKRLAKMM